MIEVISVESLSRDQVGMRRIPPKEGSAETYSHPTVSHGMMILARRKAHAGLSCKERRCWDCRYTIDVR